MFDDIHYRNRPYDKWESYGQSKTANVLFASGQAQLAQRYIEKETGRPDERMVVMRLAEADAVESLLSASEYEQQVG